MSSNVLTFTEFKWSTTFPPPTNKETTLWDVLQYHRIKKKIDELKFEGHPVFIRGMSLFIITKCVNLEEIVKFGIKPK